MWLDGEWSIPCSILAEDGPEKWNHIVLDFPGVYRLIALEDVAAKTRKICHRLCGDDQTGTLYIGQSSILHGRVSLLVRSMDPAYPIQAYRKLSEVAGKTFPVSMLAVTWQRCESPVLARARESELLHKYVAEFGELPPINGQSGAI